MDTASGPDGAAQKMHKKSYSQILHKKLEQAWQTEQPKQ
jgi:hypothetical protein